jgi:hypothetical protein
MSLSKQIVDSIITKDNMNANEKIYDALYDKTTDQIGMRRVEIAQNMFSSNNYEEYEEDSEEPYEQ